MVLAEQLDGAWDIQESSLPLGSSMVKESSLVWNSTFSGTTHRMFGTLQRVCFFFFLISSRQNVKKQTKQNKTNQDEGEYFLLAESLGNSGMVIIQVGGEQEDEPIEVMRGSFDITELTTTTKMTSGNFETRSKEIGSFEMIYSGSDITVTLKTKGSQQITSLVAHRTTAEPVRNEYVDKATIGFLIFIIAVVVSIIRNVLYIRPRNERRAAAARQAVKPKGKNKQQKVPGVSG